MDTSKLLKGHFEQIKTTGYIDILELEKMIDKTLFTPQPKNKEEAARWRDTFTRVRQKLNHKGMIINRDILPELRRMAK